MKNKLDNGYIGMNRIPEFSNYCATRDGKIWSDHKNGFLKSNIRNKRGRLSERVKVTDDNGRKRTMYVHRLVAMAWLPNPDNKETVNHKDFNTLNNHVDNLEWMTREENLNHAKKFGIIGGEYCIDDNICNEIFELNRTGYSTSMICDKFNISSSVVRKIFKMKNVKQQINYKKSKLDFNLVYNMYVNKLKPISFISKLTGFSCCHIRNSIRKMGIKETHYQIVKKTINKYYKNNKTIDEISKITGLEKKYIRNNIDNLNDIDVFKVENTYAIPTSEYNNIKKMIESGMKKSDIRNKYNVSGYAVNTALKNIAHL